MPTPKRNRKGWWKVRNAQGEIIVRAWGNGMWWTPLKGGWISSPHGYRRLRFICAMEPHESTMDPADEHGRAVERAALRR